MAKAKTDKAPPAIKPLAEVPKSKQEPVIEMIDGKTLKACPKCGSDCTGTYIDKHGHIRCNCSHPKCGYWDSRVYNTPKDAAEGWQATKAPEKVTG